MGQDSTVGTQQPLGAQGRMGLHKLQRKGDCPCTLKQVCHTFSLVGQSSLGQRHLNTTQHFIIMCHLPIDCLKTYIKIHPIPNDFIIQYSNKGFIILKKYMCSIVYYSHPQMEYFILLYLVILLLTKPFLTMIQPPLLLV